MKLNEAVSARLVELLAERGMTQYKLYALTGVTRTTIMNVVKCKNTSMNLRILYEICQGLGISLNEFFDSPLFAIENLEP